MRQQEQFIEPCKKSVVSGQIEKSVSVISEVVLARW